MLGLPEKRSYLLKVVSELDVDGCCCAVAIVEPVLGVFACSDVDSVDSLLSSVEDAGGVI